MQITDTRPKTHTRTTTLNDIPIGQVFSGRIFGAMSKRIFSGIFYKAEGPCTLHRRAGAGIPAKSQSADVVVVSLSRERTHDNQPFANVFTNCTTVYDYVPLEVELVIKGVQG